MPGCEAILAHDMAFQVDAAELLFDQAVAKDGARLLNDRIKPELQQVLFEKDEVDFFRTDLESCASRPASDLDLSLQFCDMVNPDQADIASWCLLTMVQRCNAIRTDRLHVAVASALTGTRCRLYDNIYGKNSDVFDQSLKDHFPNITLCTDFLPEDNRMPIPEILTWSIPAPLKCIDPPAGEEELVFADSVRKKFFLPGGADAYMSDIVRAFRVAQGAQVYIEVGTRDKGNLAWISHLLSPDATIIDIDLENIPVAEKKLREYLPKTQSYFQIEGSSVSADTIQQVKRILGFRKADVIFLDSSHMYDHFVKEIALYFPLLKEGGFLLVHDALWEGNQYGKGKAQALEQIDKHFPVFLTYMNEPLHRYMLRESKNCDVWGSLGIIIKP